MDVTGISDINLHLGCCLSTLVLKTRDDERLDTIHIRVCNDKGIHLERVFRNVREYDQRLLGAMLKALSDEKSACKMRLLFAVEKKQSKLS